MTAPAAPTILAIQLLRALAAGSVAVVHLAFAFSDHVGRGLGLNPAYGQLAQTAVALFFLISGYIMIISSHRLFGTPGGTRRFWLRRAFRILPPYWLATGLLVGLYLWLGKPIVSEDVLRSLLLIPYAAEGGAEPLPFLWPGWTLFHEMVFYIVFGIGVSAGRMRTVAIAAAVLTGLVIAGIVFDFASVPLTALTRPISLLFLGGMALALWRESGGVVPVWLRWVLLAATVPALMLLVALADTETRGFTYLAWSGLPAVLLFVAAVGGPFRLPFAGVIDLLGHASYAIYLLHIPAGWLWVGFYPGTLYRLGPWVHFATLLAGTVVLSIAFYRWIEKPLTRRLNLLVGG